MDFELDCDAIELGVHKIVDEQGKEKLKDGRFFLACFNDYEPEHPEEAAALKSFFDAGLGNSLYYALNMDGEKQSDWLKTALQILGAAGMEANRATPLLKAVGKGAGLKSAAGSMPSAHKPHITPIPPQQPTSPREPKPESGETSGDNAPPQQPKPEINGTDSDEQPRQPKPASKRPNDTVWIVLGAMRFIFGWLLSFLGGLTSPLWLLIAFVILVLGIVVSWKIFKKAGHPGWHSLVPIYGQYVQFKLFWGNGGLGIAIMALEIAVGTLLGWFGLLLIPLVRTAWSVLEFCISNAPLYYKMGEAFGCSREYSIAMVFCYPFTCIPLAFRDEYKYLGVPRDGWSYDELREKLKK